MKNRKGTMLRATHMKAAAALVIALSVGCSQSATDPGASAALLEAQDVLTFRSVWSGYTSATRVVVADPETWAAEWATIHAGHSEPPPVPAIDFSTSVVVIAGMGQRPSGGYEVMIERVRASNGTLFVDVRERSPSDRCIVSGALTSPLHAVQVPRQGTTASFTIRRETRAC